MLGLGSIRWRATRGMIKKARKLKGPLRLDLSHIIGRLILLDMIAQ